MNLQIDRSINISLRLVEANKYDSSFMELLSVWAMIKLIRRDSRIRFKNQKDLLRILAIGHSKWSRIVKHRMFKKMFKLTKNTLVARKYQCNGVQLTLGCGKVRLPKNRIIIKVLKKEVLDDTKILDRIREALFVNFIRNNRASLNSGEPKATGTQPNVVKSGLRPNDCPVSYANFIDSSIDNKTIAKYLGLGVTKEKEIVNLAVKNKLVEKYINIQKVANTNDPESYIKDNEHKYPIGKLIPGAYCVMWQIANSWTLCNKKGYNRSYFGKKRIKRIEKEYDVVRKEDCGFFSEFVNDNERKDLAKFLGVDLIKNSSTGTEITCPESEDRIMRKIAMEMAMKEHAAFWDGYEPSKKYQIFKRYLRGLRQEKKMERINKMAYNRYRDYALFHNLSKETQDNIKKRYEELDSMCKIHNTTAKGICGRIKRRQDEYNSFHNTSISFNQIRDMYAEFAGELTPEIAMCDSDIYMYVRTLEYEDMSDRFDLKIEDEFRRAKAKHDKMAQYKQMIEDVDMMYQEIAERVGDISIYQNGIVGNIYEIYKEMTEEEGKITKEEAEYDEEIMAQIDFTDDLGWESTINEGNNKFGVSLFGDKESGINNQIQNTNNFTNLLSNISCLNSNTNLILSDIGVLG